MALTYKELLKYLSTLSNKELNKNVSVLVNEGEIYEVLAVMKEDVDIYLTLG